VLTICYPFVGDSIGGSHKSALTLIAGLDRKRFHPLVVLHRSNGPLAEFLQAEHIPFELLPLGALSGASPSLAEIAKAQVKSFARLRSFIRGHDIDLVHSNDLRCNLTWGPASKMAACHVWHQRTVLSSSPLWRLIGMFTDHVICISETVRNTYRSYAPATTVANPFASVTVSRDEARRSLREELGIGTDRHVVGYVGRLVSGKGLEIFARLPELLPDSVFLVAGEGPLQELLPSSVRGLGFRHPVEPLIAGLDTLVAPSRQEGFGRTLVEAMMAGTPVVSSDIAAHREVSRGGQLAALVTSAEATDYAKAIAAIRDDPELANRMAQEGRAHAKANFSTATHVRAVEAIYLSLLRPNE
jgi:glycosyltransferase involved in cell wall biosynthesis